MKENPFDTQLVDRAIVFATQAHAGIERKGKGLPYIVHPLEAMAIVATLTSDPELLAAAVLHDTVEDTPVTIEQVRCEFGSRVASLVAAESIPPQGSWHDRKQLAIDRLAAASRDAKVVALGDKLSNLRAISLDYAHLGDQLWTRFQAPQGAQDIAWYYRGLAHSLSELAPTDAYQEYLQLLEKTFGR